MKRSEQIVELMDDVKKIISQMAVVDVCEEEKPVEVENHHDKPGGSGYVPGIPLGYISQNRTVYCRTGTDGADRVQNGTVQSKTPGVPDVGTDRKSLQALSGENEKDRCYGKRRPALRKWKKSFAAG